MFNAQPTGTAISRRNKEKEEDEKKKMENKEEKEKMEKKNNNKEDEDEKKIENKEEKEKRNGHGEECGPSALSIYGQRQDVGLLDDTSIRVPAGESNLG